MLPAVAAMPEIGVATVLGKTSQAMGRREMRDWHPTGDKRAAGSWRKRWKPKGVGERLTQVSC